MCQYHYNFMLDAPLKNSPFRAAEKCTTPEHCTEKSFYCNPYYHVCVPLPNTFMGRCSHYKKCVQFVDVSHPYYPVFGATCQRKPHRSKLKHHCVYNQWPGYVPEVLMQLNGCNNDGTCDGPSEVCIESRGELRMIDEELDVKLKQSLPGVTQILGQLRKEGQSHS